MEDMGSINSIHNSTVREDENGDTKMKVVIEKETDLLGDEYLHQEEVTANIGMNDKNLLLEVDDAQYIIPLAIIKGLEAMNNR